MMDSNTLIKTSVDELNPKKFIIIKGARVNNLKNLSVAIPRNKLVVITGLSGSGKSSLAFDTLFAEGQRKYVESLSSYARQFLGRMEKPEVDYIKGVSPAIAIEQKVNTRNPRSTVGTSTEIYDYLKLLFARIGKTYSPVSGKEVSRDTISSVVDWVYSFGDGRVVVSCPVKLKSGRSVQQEMNILLSKGYTRLIQNGELKFIEEMMSTDAVDYEGPSIEVLIDRAEIISDNEDNQYRISDSVQTAFFEGEGTCYIDIIDHKKKEFSDRFELDGILFEEPTVNLFTFNNPYGACRRCEGFGKVLGIDEDLVIPDKSLSVFEGAIAPWRSEAMSEWLAPLLDFSTNLDFPIHRSFRELEPNQKELLWKGNGKFQGLDKFFHHLESQTYKIQYRVLLSRYRGKTTCPECQGTRLRSDTSFVKINKLSITDLVLMPIAEVLKIFDSLQLDEHQNNIAKRLLTEIRTRLGYLDKVGLGYLTLNRLTSTLSGGEYQRIKLATSLGSALVGSMYILDEPSIGLHPRDTRRLVEVLEKLRNLGNTVIVVEHEEEVMKAADEIIDIGPAAGSHGGELVFQGNWDQLRNETESITARYLNGALVIRTPDLRRKWHESVKIIGARENNLKDINVEIPLGVMTIVTGVSGSGKSTLVRRILYPAIGKILGTVSEMTGKFDQLSGDYKHINAIEMVDQNPIGKSSRSNPVTYVKAYDAIRQLFSDQTLAKQRGYKPSHFSFNIEGGRCENCQGEGEVRIEMQFMADIHLTCEVCNGKRFKQELLEVKFKDQDISNILDMTIDESIEFFNEKKAIVSRLKPLQDVGLGYVRLGQSSNTLSGGEAQRVKLASFIGKGNSMKDDHTLFIFDEPTTGLHFHDIRKLLDAMNALVNQGNTVLIIEHNVEVIKSADWVIDLGPEGGDKGGNLVFAGTPEDMVKAANGYTAEYLKRKL
ncbi:MAG: excinuclease ABC subunit UvrA [Bacteroidetes bacterium]|nr:excinuclease ABC subunit UvrA [Bacteroidota bacterium]MDA1121325.1 excinuclease ABC subunit UvrA [Bacteroidota bacterium]